MSLIGALNAGKTALAVTQAAIQVTGNNISNAGNADYTRQTAVITQVPEQQIRPGMFLGTGVDLSEVRRQIDTALETRLRGSMSDNAAANSTQQWLSRMEAVFNELSDQDLSTQLSTFFNSWSNLANKPQDVGLRQVVMQNGEAVANWFRNLDTQLSNLEKDVDQRMTALASNADALAQRVADLNAQIVVNEGGAAAGSANGLRDQRDAVLKQLAQLIDIRTVEQADGVVNVYVGSEPLVSVAENRGVGVRQDASGGDLKKTVIIKATNGAMKLSAGELGSLTDVRASIDEVGTKINDLANTLIFEINKMHSSGQGTEGLSSTIGTNAVDDVTGALNDSSKTGLNFAPINGSFVLHVKNKATGLTTSTLVKVDLDGLNGNDTTMTSLAADLNAIDGISATITANKLSISADSSGVSFNFSQDSSGILAALGINTFYKGSVARDITVNPLLKSQPSLLAAARNGEPGDNQTALAIATLESQALKRLGGQSLKESYQSLVNQIAVTAAGAKTSAEAAQAVQETLESQRQALSGVSLDEEAINLMRQQRAFQAASRLVAVVDEMMRTVLNLV